ncbi:MAG TPA: cortexillin II [Clostridia bacterium]|nr:cortexillin II [Clostridia bacterium]
MERKRKTVETQITEIEAKKAQYQAKINNYKAKISDLDSKIRDLKDIQKQKELENLLDVIKTSGKTPEEVIAAIKIGNVQN